MRPKRIVFALGSIVVLLLAGHYGIAVVSEVTGHPFYRLPRFFDLSQEANLPTFFSALNLLFASALLALIAATTSNRKRTWVAAWWVLAAGFAAMSLDEMTLVHESIIGSLIIHWIGRGDGIFYYRWYLLYAPMCLVIFALYIPFLRKLPLRFSSWFLAAGSLFILGAIGVEMVQSSLASSGASTLRILINVGVEEGLEMIAIVIFNGGLLTYLAESGADVSFRFGADSPPSR